MSAVPKPRDSLAKRVRCYFSPAELMGIELGTWWRLLRENRFAVDPYHWPRALVTTACSVANSVLGSWERQRYGRQIAAMPIVPPLVVLGQARSGTTHLQRLLAVDPRLAAPNLFQVRFPHTFLTAESWLAPWTERWVAGRRYQDNVATSWKQSGEEEFALALLTLCSPRCGRWFPRNRARYSRYVTMEEVEPAGRERWAAAFGEVLRKLCYRHRCRLVLKSPVHTARLPLLVPLLPGAAYVHLHRHPYEVLQSRLHMYRHRPAYFGLQRGGEVGGEEAVFAEYRTVCRAYFRHRGLLPAEQFCEVRFADLERDPLGELRRIYRLPGMPDFAGVEAALRRHLAESPVYEKNRHAPLAEPWRRRLREECPEAFAEWGYEP